MGNNFKDHILAKRFFSSLLALVVILSMCFTEKLYSPLSTTVKATSAVTITVSPTKCTLYVGQSKTLKTTVKNTSSKVSYSSSNKTVATVDSKGKITAKSKGSATITAKVAGKTAKCVVKVKDVVIRLNSTQKILYVDSTYQLKATVTGSSKAVSWKSSNTSIATVNNKGLVTAKKSGTAKITARVEKTTVTCVVTVKDIVITLSRKDFILFNTESVSITAKVVGSSKSPVWKSFNPGLVTVSGSGNTVTITAKKAGTAKISATLGNTTVNCIVRIYDYVSKIELSTNKVEIYPNQKYQVKAKVYPDTAYYKDVTWSISDKTVASIEKGCITAIKPGTCTIRATSQDKKKVFAECNLTVHQPVTSISFAQSSYELYKCSKLKIKPTVKPDNAFNKKVRYVVNDPTVGKISETGEIQPYRIGTLTVHCYACDGQGAYGVFTVNIRQNINYISFDKKEISVGTGLTCKLKTHISPENAYNKNLKYVSSNTNVVTVDKNGVIKGVNQGKAKVMALATDGSKHQCYCNISVFVSAKKLRISGSTKITVNHKYTNFKLSAYPQNSYLNKVKWYSSNPKVATIDSKGKVR
ncbi:MAG: Ig-like domain-containing protein, partial [Ruminococcus sp.]